MAAKGSDDSGERNASGGNAPTDKGNSLEGFTTSQQSLNRAENPGKNVDEKKTNRSMSKTKSESKRVHQEAAQSKAKMGKVHEKLGQEQLALRRLEHFPEFLAHQGCQSVEMTHNKQ